VQAERKITGLTKGQDEGSYVEGTEEQIHITGRLGL
jgi:hypothetical protein